MYSTGNYTQYLIITYNGRECKKKRCIYRYLNHFAIHLKLIQHCKSTIFQYKLKKKKPKKKRKKEIERRWPSASQGERPREKPNLLTS